METNQICTENCHLQFSILSIDCLFSFKLQFIQSCLSFFFQKFIAFMEKLNAVLDESFYLADYVALNLFMLDCRCLNKVIVTLLYEIRNFVTDYFKALNQKENRR